jgi:hypothetical protein
MLELSQKVFICVDALFQILIVSLLMRIIQILMLGFHKKYMCSEQLLCKQTFSGTVSFFFRQWNFRHVQQQIFIYTWAGGLFLHVQIGEGSGELSAR